MRQWRIALQAWRLTARYPLRTGLLVVAAALGVAGVVCSADYVEGGTAQLLDQIRRLGTNVLIVTPAESRAIAGRARTGTPVTTLDERDYTALKTTIRGVGRSSAVVTRQFRIKAGDLSKTTTVVACEPDYFAIRSWSVADGAVWTAVQERQSARVALLGRTAALDLFGRADAVGRRITINRVPFQVVGVLTERGQGLDVGNEDTQVYVPLTAAMRRLANVTFYSAVVVEIASMDRMDPAADELRALLHLRHHIQPSRPDDFQVQNQKTIIDTQMAAASRLRALLRWIAAGALLVSGLGIAAINWIAVKARTRELGTRRALGATAADIFLQTQYEATAVALAGGAAGLAAAWPLSREIGRAAGLPFVFDAPRAVLAFAIAVALNLACALWPARAAASISPMEALQSE
jgi:putative ABC transport system permease protein